MVYITLLCGILITLYALVVIIRDDRAEVSDEPPAPSEVKSGGEELAPSFQTNLASQVEKAADAGLLYELKEKVEVQLSELSRQKELVTHLMMRVEKKLEHHVEAAPRQKKEKRVQEAKEEILTSDYLERARLHNDIYLLYDQGINVTEIARQVGKGKGEVQLILGLRK